MKSVKRTKPDLARYPVLAICEVIERLTQARNAIVNGEDHERICDLIVMQTDAAESIFQWWKIEWAKTKYPALARCKR